MRRAATEWRVAARLARREVRRRPGRMALVLVLVGLPVAGMTLYTVGARSTSPTAAELRTYQLGRADDLATAPDGTTDAATFQAALEAAYPPGSRFVRFETTQEAVTEPDGRLEQISVTNRPLEDPLTEGTMPLVTGRAPRESDEVVIDLELAQMTDAQVGSSLELLLLGKKTVTGIVADPLCATSCPVVVTTDPLTHRPTFQRQALVDAPPGFTYANSEPLAAVNGYTAVGPDAMGTFRTELRQRQAIVYLVGVVVLAVTTVIAMAAFAVATRRQMRLLGVLSASGAPPSGLRRAVLLEGTTAGLVGSTVGVVLGLLLARGLFPYFDDVSNDYVPRLEVHPLDLLGPFVLGVLATTIAAWLPARMAGRVPVLAALAGRHAQDRLPARNPVYGIVAIAAGIVCLAWALGGIVLGLRFGSGAAAVLVILWGGIGVGSWLVSRVEPLSRWIRGGGRLALRDLARQRLRSGAVVASIMAPAGVLVLSLTTAAMDDAQSRVPDDISGLISMYDVADSQVLLIPPGGWATGVKPPESQLADLRRILPGAVEEDIHVVLPQQPTSTGFPGATVRRIDPATGLPSVEGALGAGRYLITVDPALLAEAGSPSKVVDALEQGKIVMSEWPGTNQGASYTLDGITAPVEPGDIVVFDDVPTPRGDQVATVSPETAAAWGAQTIYYGTMFDSPEPLTSTQLSSVLETGADDGCAGLDGADCRDALIRASLLGETDPNLGKNYLPQTSEGRVSATDDNDLGRYGFAGVLLVFTLLVVTIALALSAAESRDERALLAAIGAPPSIRRAMTAWQAGLLPAIAMLVAVPAGIAIAAATEPAWLETGLAFGIPWLEIALVAAGIPLASAAVTWLGTSLTGRRRRDLSVLALAAD